MRLGEAIYQAITGGRSSGSEVGTWGDAIGWFMRRGGSVAGAAREAGVPASTFRGWLKGALPRSSRAGAIVDAARGAQRWARISPGRQRRLSRAGAMSGASLADSTYGYGQPGVNFTPSTAGFTHGRPRKVDIGQYLNDDAGADLVDAYLDGADLDELEAIFADSIYGARFYEDSFDPQNPDGHGWDIGSLDGWGS